jgi:hypothetical protein
MVVPVPFLSMRRSVPVFLRRPATVLPACQIPAGKSVPFSAPKRATSHSHKIHAQNPPSLSAIHAFFQRNASHDYLRVARRSASSAILSHLQQLPKGYQKLTRISACDQRPTPGRIFRKGYQKIPVKPVGRLSQSCCHTTRLCHSSDCVKISACRTRRLPHIRPLLNEGCKIYETHAC